MRTGAFVTVMKRKRFNRWFSQGQGLTVLVFYFSRILDLINGVNFLKEKVD